MPHKHVSRVGEGIQTISDVKELCAGTLTLCLHNNFLQNLNSISNFTRLVDLNVSLNRLVSINGIQNLSCLTSLNLASNLLENCHDLVGLSRLRSLQLQYNSIRELSALCQLRQANLTLVYLDLRGNKYNADLEARSIDKLSSIPTLRLSPAEEVAPPWSMLAQPHQPAVITSDASVQTPPDETLDRLGLEAVEMRRQLEDLGVQLQRREAEAGSDQAALRLVKKEMTLKVAEVKLHASAALKGSSEELKAAQQKATALEAQVKALETSKAGLERAVTAARDDNADILSQREALQSILADARAGTTVLQTQLQQQGNDLVAVKEDLAAAIRAKGLCVEEQIALERQLRDTTALQAELDRQKQRSLEASQGCEQASQQIAAMGSRILELEQSEAQLTAANGALLSQQSQLQLQLQSTQEAHKAELEAQQNCWLLKEAQIIQHGEEAQDQAAKLGAQIKTLEDSLQQTVQGAEDELHQLQASRNAAAEEASQLRAGLQSASAHIEEQDRLLGDMRNASHRQKARMAELQQELGEAKAKLAAYNPRQSERLLMEVGRLRETVATLTSHKEHALKTQQYWKRVEKEVAAEKADSAALLQRLRQDIASWEQRCQAEGARASKATEQVKQQQDAFEALKASKSKELTDMQDAVKIKSAMLDSANESVAELKASLAASQRQTAGAQSDLRVAQLRLDDADPEAISHLRRIAREQQEDLQALRTTIAKADQRVAAAEKQSRRDQEALREREEMVGYVTDEVDRLKGLFQEKEERLIHERDKASADLEEASKQCQETAARLKRAEAEAASLSVQIKEKDHLKLEAQAAADRSSQEAQRAAQRLAQVEGETKQLLVKLERQKTASASKIQQLASVVHELQGL